MSLRVLQTVFFAVVILAAHMHCVAVHALGARATIEARLAAIPPAPSPSSSTCENESGCICKGATLALAVDGPTADLAWSGLLPTVTISGLDRPQPDELVGLWSACAGSFSVSSETLRALLQTYRL